MAGLEGKVALISGAARGMGRTHALELARAGADIVGFDIVSAIETIAYPPATPDDLELTAKLVGELGRRMLTHQADVRDQRAVDAVVEAALREFGRLDIVVANAGVLRSGPSRELAEDEWRDVIDVNLTGVWHTVRASLPTLIDSGSGGSIVIIGSGAIGFPGVAAYSAAKAGCVGLTRSLASELARYGVRVNLIHPTVVGTPMLLNEVAFRRRRPDLENPTEADVVEQMRTINSLDVAYIAPEDVSRAVAWLVSDDARYVTGIELRVDAGSSLQH